MSGISMDDLSGRILQLLDGELEAEDLLGLEDELRASKQARVIFHQLVALHSALEVKSVSQSEIGNVPLIPVERHLARQRRRVIKKTLFATAAILTLAALGLWMKMISLPEPSLVEFRLGPDAAFILTHAEGDDAPGRNVLREGSRLQLTQGTMEGVFESGTHFLVEAPCDFSVLSGDRIALAEGVAWFEVPVEATGFTVETAELTVVDLGTEFGLVARAGEFHEVHVIRGLVEVSAAGGQEELRLKGGQARRVDSAGVLHEIPLQPGRFQVSLPSVIEIRNPSFEADENTSADGNFASGERLDFGGQLTGWIAKNGDARWVQVGWKDIDASERHPYPVKGDREFQVLSLISGASVLNVTKMAWSRLRPGDELTLTISLGMRGGNPELQWNRNTFFGLTDGSADLTHVELQDTVSNSGVISTSPAGVGSFADVSFSYTVQEADRMRPGKVGILIHAQQAGGRKDSINQSFFDNVRLRLGKTSVVSGEDR